MKETNKIEAQKRRAQKLDDRHDQIAALTTAVTANSHALDTVMRLLGARLENGEIEPVRARELEKLHEINTTTS